MEEEEDYRKRGTVSRTETPVPLRPWSALCTTLFGSLGVFRKLLALKGEGCV